MIRCSTLRSCDQPAQLKSEVKHAAGVIISRPEMLRPRRGHSSGAPVMQPTPRLKQQCYPNLPDLVTVTALLARLCCVFWCTCKCHGYSALGSATCIAVLDAAALHACALLQVVRRQAAQHGLAPLVHERTWGENLLGNATIALRMCAVVERAPCTVTGPPATYNQQSASETKPPIISSDVLHPSNITTLPLVAA